MGEALITRPGGVSGGGSSGSGNLVTNIFTTSGTFIVPKAKDQQFSVRIFGGGGGGLSLGLTVNATNNKINEGEAAGGGGGRMNNGIFALNEGDTIPISIGIGGKGINFYSSKRAELVVSAKPGGTTSFGTYLSALGGEGAWHGSGETVSAYGGSGGSGGGGSYGGGTGYQFGGGGSFSASREGGDGGKWGGGGGSVRNTTSQSNGGCLYENSQNIAEITGYSGLAGNGSCNRTYATDGTNTIGNNEVQESLQGPGLCGIGANGNYNNKCGGGGYGGCGGNNAGGGGGYGGNGGCRAGGGGGYGGDGGNNYGGGGSYGYGGSDGRDGIFGGGGGGSIGSSPASVLAGNGGDGICIIQYYA